MVLTTVVSDHPDDEQPEAAVITTLEQLARAMRVPSGELQPTLEAIVAAAVRAVPGVDDAGLILISKGQLSPISTTGERPQRLDALQHDLTEGPCFDAAAQQETILVRDLVHDARWPRLRAAAAELDVVSMLCVPLWIEGCTNGALSLYSGCINTFDQADIGWAELFATHAALALADAQRAEQLRAALANRDVLGQAKGILMERLRITSEAAFAMLSQRSQQTNVKVAVVAASLAATGELAGADLPGSG